ncbi:MAG: hypothetical protein ACR2MD_06915 [Aridibacter sp.]
MKKQIKSNWQNPIFTLIISLAFVLMLVLQATAQSEIKYNALYNCPDSSMYNFKVLECDGKDCKVLFVNTYTPSASFESKVRKSHITDAFTAGGCTIDGKKLDAVEDEPQKEENTNNPDKSSTVTKTTKNNSESQKNWSEFNKWRSGFKVGDKIKFSISEKAEDFQTCTVTENDPQFVMRVECDDFKYWEAGVYIVYSESNLKSSKTQPTNGNGRNNTPPKQTGSSSSGLKVGEYACYGSGGRIMAGLGFKVLSGNRYTDLEGGNAGTFVISGDRVKFRGGHLGGQVGRELSNYNFRIGAQATCEPF